MQIQLQAHLLGHMMGLMHVPLSLWEIGAYQQVQTCFTFGRCFKNIRHTNYFSLELLCNTDYHEVYNLSHQTLMHVTRCKNL